MQSTQADDDELTITFAALANTTRRAILARLATGEATVSELAEPFDISLPAISKHVKVLEQAGLIVQGQRAQYRPCTLEIAPLEAVSAWADHYRSMWEGRLDRMEALLDQMQDPLQNSSSPPTTPTTTTEGSTK